MSGFYKLGKERLLARLIPSAAKVWVAGINDEYAFSADHQTFSEVESYILLAETELENVSFSDGVLNADDAVWESAGADIEDDRSLFLNGALFYFVSGATKTLLAFIDSAAVGLPQEVTGVDITGQWNSQGILRL